jgi:3-hydroxyisobutyrate dehydrogenase-like beta-hydroxyacid dehydrogenase
METVGIVGLGNMGSALFSRLRLAQVEAVGYDVDAAALDRARADGVEPVSSSAEVARAATLVDVVVRTDEEVLDCTLGSRGVLEGARPGTLVLLHSTILPQTTLRVAEAARARGVHVIDACMLSIPASVRAGDLVFVVGGPEDLVNRARPHLLNMGKEVRHVGPLGTGNVAKLIRNLMGGAETLILHEAIRLGAAGGIPYVQTLELLRETQSGSLLDRWQRTFDPSGADPTPNVGANVLGKDVPLAGALAREYGLDLPIIQQLGEAGLRLAEGSRQRA